MRGPKKKQTAGGAKKRAVSAAATRRSRLASKREASGRGKHGMMTEGGGIAAVRNVLDVARGDVREDHITRLDDDSERRVRDDLKSIERAQRSAVALSDKLFFG